MAKLYGEIAAKTLLTLDKSFARANGQPLDASEVYYSLDAAKEYAATAQAYIGQKIVVVEDNVVTHYSVEDEAGNLKELGAAVIGDEKSIHVNDDGSISLYGIESLEFERDVIGEDDQPTGEKETVQYQPLMTSAGLVWVEPSKTTVEGLNTLLEALTVRVKSLEDNSVTKAELATARAEISEEIDADVKVAKDRADEAYALAESKVDSEEYAADKEAIDNEAAAIRAIAEEAKASIDTFLNSEEIDETVNTLKEVQAEIEKMTDATELTTALASKADITYVDDEIAEAVEGMADVYATKTELGELETAVNGRLETLEAIDHEAYTTNVVFNEYKTTVENTYATQEVVNNISQVANNAANKVDTLEDKVEEITSVGGEPNTIDYIKVNGSILEVEKDENGDSTKTVNITVPTKASDLTDDTGFDARITAAQNKADEATNAASTAQTAANAAQADVDAVEKTVGEHATKISTLETTVADHGARIVALENADTQHAAEYNALKEIVNGHTATIAGKADQSALDAVSAKAAANETAINTINTTTIPSLNTEIAKKANVADVYTKSEVDAITGTPDEGKTLVEMIADAKSEASYDDTAIKALIQGNTDAITILNGDASTAGSVIAIANAQAKAEVATIVGTAPETMDTLQEVAEWIANDESGAAAMAADIATLKVDVAAINDETTGILAVAKKYTDDSIAGLPLASGTVVGLVKVDDKTIQAAEDGTISVKAISTDLLTQGTQELILDGGNAETAASN